MLLERVTVVVPTYNERDNLPLLARTVVAQGYRLLVVDDASPDGTGDVADRLATELPGIAVLHRNTKAGLGRAYGAAFDHVLEGDSEIVVQMDADFSHDPADLPRLVNAVVSGADLAIGSRYVPGGSTPDWPLLRRFISRSGNLYARTLLRIPVGDITAGYRAYRAEALRKLPYRQAQASGYGFQVEMTLRAADLEMEIAEVPVIFRDRTRGESKMGLGIVVEAMRLVTVWGLQRIGRRRRGRRG